MTALLCCLLWWLLPSLQEDLENAARRAYLEGRYGEAQQLFEAALEQGAPDGTLLYNIGNCAYRLGHYAEAVLAYRRALLRLPGNPKVQDNLTLAERELGIFREPVGSIAARLGTALDALPPGTMLWLCGVLQAAGLVGLVLLRGFGRRAGMAGIAALGLALGARVAQEHWFPDPPDGVVLANEITVRAEPHRAVGVVLVLQAGELVRIEEHSDRWVRITHPRGGGWTRRMGVGFVQ